MCKRIKLNNKNIPLPNTLDELIGLTLRQVDFTLHDETVKKVRKLLTIEQFRNERMSTLATKHFSGDIEAIYTDIFENLMKNGKVKTDNLSLLALGYTAPITMLIHLCDREPQRETEIVEKIKEHMDHAFAELLAQKTDKELLKEKRCNEEEIQKAIVRNETVSNLYEKLYEDNATGKVSDEWFMQLSHKYEAERMELKSKISMLRQKLSESGQYEKDRSNFTEAIRLFMQMDKLTAPLLRELIDRIEVFETEGKGKDRTQRIIIYYRFVGYVELPDIAPRPHVRADTRKGVSVEYLTEPLGA